MKNITINPPPEREIRALYNNDYIRVYQAYSDQIADNTLQNNSFSSPPFKLTRMTWIKPSFLWMMYRSGWGYKDQNQKRILAIDISHDGFLWALSNSCLSNFKSQTAITKESWQKQKDISSVRVQWDPERDILLNKLNYRSIQIGLTGDAVKKYTQDWIVNITDITDLAHQIKSKINANRIDQANEMIPKEKIYSIAPKITEKLGIYS